MERVRIKLKLAEGVDEPKYAHGPQEDAGMDLRANERVVIPSCAITAVPTGVFVEIPTGLQGEVRTRSGMALKGVIVNNAPGTIDPGYRGEIKVILRNQGPLSFNIEKGDRIAQLVVVPYVAVEWDRADELAASARGESGFGASGVR